MNIYVYMCINIYMCYISCSCEYPEGSNLYQIKREGYIYICIFMYAYVYKCPKCIMYCSPSRANKRAQLRISHAAHRFSLINFKTGFTLKCPNALSLRFTALSYLCFSVALYYVHFSTIKHLLLALNF